MPTGVSTSRKHLAEGITFGRYVLIEELGSGGMGVVYAALDPDLNRRVALKLIRGDRAASGRADSDSQRLLREARAMARLHHPNVVTVHDVGTIDGRVFVAMEYVQGQTLKQWIEAGPHPHARVLDVMVRAGRGLVAAHDAGIIHRDFKPDNVLLGEDDTVKVLDFGLARPPDATASTEDEPARPNERAYEPESFRTRAGIVLGTPLYMSPEQHRGFPLDERSDQFSFCAVAYEALFGQRPFSGRTRSALALQACKGQIEPIPEASGVPAHVRNAIRRGLAPEARNRWPSMRELLSRLELDPTASRRGAGLAAAAIGLGALAIVAITWPRPPDNACAAEAARVDEVWNEARQTAVEARVMGETTAWATTSAGSTAEIISKWAARWSAERLDACEATVIRHDRSEAHQALRSHCLQLQLDALVEILARLPPVHAVATVSRLPEPSGCRDDARLAAIADTDDEDAGELFRELAVLQALEPSQSTGTESRALVDTANHAQNLNGLARAKFELARQQAANGQLDEAIALLEASAQSAVGLGDAELAVQAWIRQADLERRQGRLDRARLWLSYASAQIPQVPASARLAAELATVAARVSSAAKEHTRAIEAAAAALDAWREAVGSEHLAVADALSELALALEAAGQSEPAKAPAEQAHELRRALLGLEHPDVSPTP